MFDNKCQGLRPRLNSLDCVSVVCISQHLMHNNNVYQLYLQQQTKQKLIFYGRNGRFLVGLASFHNPG